MSEESLTTDTDPQQRGQGSDAGGPAAAFANDVRVKAGKLNELRMECVSALANAAGARQQAIAALDEAERAYRAAYKEARRAGWEEKELTSQLGLPSPTSGSRGRKPRKPAAESADSTTQDQ